VGGNLVIFFIMAAEIPRTVDITPSETCLMDTVFHVSEEARFQGAVHGALNLLEDTSVSMDRIVIVANGGAVRSLLKGGRGEELLEQARGSGIIMKACKNSLMGMRIDRARLVDGVSVVSSGVGELTRLQSEGFAYIRV
jgi:intracellular sulfur oxidation DsrE/DsrF family protein